MTTSDSNRDRQEGSTLIRGDYVHNTHTYLVRVLEGDVEVELSEDEELTLHNAVPQVPELLITF